MQWTTSASHLKTSFFTFIKFLPRLFSKTFHPHVCPSTYHHPQLTSRAGKLFRGIPPTPSLHTNCNQYVDANVPRHTSRAFRDPKLQGLHLNLRAVRPCAGRDQIFSPGW